MGSTWKDNHNFAWGVLTINNTSVTVKYEIHPKSGIYVQVENIQDISKKLNDFLES